jgi:alpha-L-arabinofuranosidase
VILKIVSPSEEVIAASVRLEGARAVSPDAEVTVLTADRLDAVNTVYEPARVAPAEQAIHDTGAKFAFAFAARSLTVLRLGMTDP